GRPTELDAAFEVRVASLLLGEGRGRQHHGGAIPLRPWQVIPRGEELHRRGDSGGRRRTPAEQRLDPVEAVPTGDPGSQGAALVGAAVQGELLAAHLLRQVAAGTRKVVDVLAAVAVAEQDGHRPARIFQQLMRRKLAHLGRGAAGLMPDVHGAWMPVQVDAFGVDDDELRAALRHGLLDAQVDDGYVVFGVGGDHNNDARVIYVLDAHQVRGRRREGGTPVHLDLGALERAVEQALEQERLLVGQVLRERDA